MQQSAIKSCELAAFTSEGADNHFALIMTPESGEPFLLSMNRSVAGGLAARLVEAFQQLEREGTKTAVPRSPERVLEYNAMSDRDQRTGDRFVLLGLVGDRSQPYIGAMKPADARRLGAKLMAEAEAPSTPAAN